MAVTLTSVFTNIAAAIRRKTKTQTKYTPDGMVEAINNFVIGDIELEDIEITSNCKVTPNEGSAFNSVTANVTSSGGSPQQGITVIPLTITQNGTYTPPVGYAYSPITINIV